MKKRSRTMAYYDGNKIMMAMVGVLGVVVVARVPYHRRTLQGSRLEVMVLVFLLHHLKGPGRSCCR